MNKKNIVFIFNLFRKKLWIKSQNKILNSNPLFLSLIIILSILEEISFFKESNVNFIVPYLITLLKGNQITVKIISIVVYVNV